MCRKGLNRYGGLPQMRKALPLPMCQNRRLCKPVNWTCNQCKDLLKDSKLSAKTSTPVEQESTSSTSTNAEQQANVQAPKTIQSPTNAANQTNVQSMSNIQNPTDDIQSSQNVETPTAVETPENVQPSTDVQPNAGVDRPKNNSSISIPSSASSKRRSLLQLEKLKLEKAIQQKLIEDKAKLETEYLQKLYNIIENESDSEDERLPIDPAEKSEYVADWLNTSRLTTLETDPLSRPNSETSDLTLIPSKQTQFVQPLASDTSIQGKDRTLVFATGQTEPLSNLEPQSTMSTSRNNQYQPLLQETPTSTNQNGTAYQMDPPPFVMDPINQEPDQTQQLHPTTPIVAQQSFTSSPITQQSISATTQQPPMASTAVQAQSYSNQIVTSAVHNSMNVTSSTSQTLSNANPYQSFVSIPIVQPTSVQQPFVVASVAQQPFVNTSVLQQPFVTTSVIQQPTSTYHQPYIPMSSYQQPITTPVISQAIPNIAQQTMFGPNATLNASGFNQQLVPMYGSGNMSTMNVTGLQQSPPIQGVTYDPQLNPQQLPPNRLQLAARQTMKKEYPKFNGDPGRWSIFLNAYVNCTTTCGLSNGENLSRLEECLQDPARKAVNNLLTSPEAVPEIIGTLKLLYGQPEASIDAQISNIKNEPPPKMNKMETFIDFSMSVRNVTSEIQKSGMWPYLWNPQLLQDLVNKLPYQMRMDWGLVKMSNPNANLSNFSDWLYLRAQTACAVTLPSSEKKNNKPNSNGHVNAHSKGNNSDKKASNDNTKPSTNSNGRNCFVCHNTSHDTPDCRKLVNMSINDRWEAIKTNKLCRICLGNHYSTKCESTSLCGESGCTMKHHRLLHNSSKTVTSATKDNSSSSNVHNSNPNLKVAILRRYVPVTLYGPKGSLNVIAFLTRHSSNSGSLRNWESVVNMKTCTSSGPQKSFEKNRTRNRSQ